MRRAWLAAACLVAGVAVLAGAGWALLVAAVVIYLTPVPDSARAWLGAARGRLVRAWQWLAGGRRALAVASMPPAVVLVPLGVAVSFGLGAALIATGLLMGGLSLILGWNQG